MNNNRLRSMQEFKSTGRVVLRSKRHAREEWHETLAEHARHTGTGTRQRVRLVVAGLASRLHASVEEASMVGRRIDKRVGVRMVLLASRKLVAIADKIERKARSIRQE